MTRLPTLGRFFGHRWVRRSSAILLASSVPWVIWTAVAAPLIENIGANQERAARYRAVLQRYDKLVAALPALEADQSARALAAAADGHFYQGGNAAITGTRLQGDVQRLAAASRLEIRTSQTLPALQEAGFEKLGLQLELAGDSEALMRFLDAVERAEPALVVGELSIHVPQAGVPPLTPEGQVQLSIRFRLFGYGRKGAA